MCRSREHASAEREDPLVDYYKCKILVLISLYIGFSTLFIRATPSFSELSSAQLRRIYR